MIGQPRIGTKALAGLCHRLAMSLGAGVDVRTVAAREADHARGPLRARLAAISDEVAQGGSFSDGVDATGSYFPPFFRELVRVGEQAGQLPEVFRRLAEHFDYQLVLRRSLVLSILWPAIELTLALGVVGILIYLMGAVPELAKSGVDLTGLGLKGTSGLVTYLTFLGVVGLGIGAVVSAASRGLLWVAPIQRVVMRVPKLGGALETFAMARLAWGMHVTLNTGMDTRKAMKLALDNTHNALYTRHSERVLAAIRAGQPIHEALTRTRAFPRAFVEIVQVGEESGQLVEAMGTLSAQYQDEARAAMRVLTVLLGFAVLALMAAVIIYLIYQVFVQAYLNPIRDMMKPI